MLLETFYPTAFLIEQTHLDILHMLNRVGISSSEPTHSRVIHMYKVYYLSEYIF